jgi:hypothetical protein
MQIKDLHKERRNLLKLISIAEKMPQYKDKLKIIEEGIKKIKEEGVCLNLEKFLQIDEKFCGHCNTVKSVSAFNKAKRYVNRDFYYYYQAYCIICHKEVNEANKAKRNKDEVKEYHRKYWENYDRNKPRRKKDNLIY